MKAYEETSRFFGNIHYTSSKYFEIEKQVIDEDNIIIFTNNVTAVKGSPVLIVDNNKAVYLKDWQLAGVGIKDENGQYIADTYAVKINRNYFKAYTFKSDFNNVSFDEQDTFDSLKALAEEQEKTGKSIKSFSLNIYSNSIEKH